MQQSRRKAAAPCLQPKSTGRCRVDVAYRRVGTYTQVRAHTHLQVLRSTRDKFPPPSPSRTNFDLCTQNSSFHLFWFWRVRCHTVNQCKQTTHMKGNQTVTSADWLQRKSPPLPEWETAILQWHLPLYGKQNTLLWIEILWSVTQHHQRAATVTSRGCALLSTALLRLTGQNDDFTCTCAELQNSSVTKNCEKRERGVGGGGGGVFRSLCYVAQVLDVMFLSAGVLRSEGVTSWVCVSLEIAGLIYGQTEFEQCCNEKKGLGIFVALWL